MANIRLARPDDAQAIHLILQETWGESLELIWKCDALNQRLRSAAMRLGF